MRLKRFLLPTVCLTAAALAFLLVPDASAQFGLSEAAGGAGLKNPGVPALIGRILKALLGFVGTLFLILMVYAGFLWMTARGDSKKVDQAKQLITGAIIGVVIIAGAYAMTDFVIKAVTGTGASQTTGESSPAETPPPAEKSGLGGPCTTNDDCDKNVLNCESGTCRAIQDAFCMGDETCVSGLKCNSNRCEP